MLFSSITGSKKSLHVGKTDEEAVIDTIKHTGPAVLIALIITALGFFSLFTSSVPMIQDFGKLLMIGIAMLFYFLAFPGSYHSLWDSIRSLNGIYLARLV